MCEFHFPAEQFMCPSDKGIYKPRKQLRNDEVPTIFAEETKKDKASLVSWFTSPIN
jgi:hypothetical protein